MHGFFVLAQNSEKTFAKAWRLQVRVVGTCSIQQPIERQGMEHYTVYCCNIYFILQTQA